MMGGTKKNSMMALSVAKHTVHGAEAKESAEQYENADPPKGSLQADKNLGNQNKTDNRAQATFRCTNIVGHGVLHSKAIFGPV